VGGLEDVTETLPAETRQGEGVVSVEGVGYGVVNEVGSVLNQKTPQTGNAETKLLQLSIIFIELLSYIFFISGCNDLNLVRNF